MSIFWVLLLIILLSLLVVVAFWRLLMFERLYYGDVTRRIKSPGLIPTQQVLYRGRDYSLSSFIRWLRCGIVYQDHDFPKPPTRKQRMVQCRRCNTEWWWIIPDPPPMKQQPPDQQECVVPLKRLTVEDFREGAQALQQFDRLWVQFGDGEEKIVTLPVSITPKLLFAWRGVFNFAVAMIRNWSGRYDAVIKNFRFLRPRETVAEAEARWAQKKDQVEQD